MSKKNLEAMGKPEMVQLEKELHRETYKNNFGKVFRSTIYGLIIIAAVVVLVAVTLLPVFQITGTSMTDSLQDGDICVALNGSKYEKGDIIAFYYNNNILVKRVIATSGEWVDIDEDGNVSVDGELLDEPYISEKALGDCNITLPYQVPESKIFVMGDHRATSIDSRNTAVGCVSEEMVIGKLLACIWPLSDFGQL